LRLLDTTGYVWAKRDLTPLAAYARTSSNDACLEAIALNVPAGLPPGPYQLAIGVGPQQSDQLFTPANGTISPLVTIGQVDVTAPSEALSPQRLPIEHWLRAPVEAEGLALLGHAGLGANATILAGDEVALT